MAQFESVASSSPDQREKTRIVKRASSYNPSPVADTILGRLRTLDHALTTTELADLLNIAPLTVHRWSRAGKVPFFRLGNLVRFCPATVAEWLAKKETAPRRAKAVAA